MANYIQTNLALLRKWKKLTQEEAATGMGFKRTTYSNYENGHTEPDIEALQKISSFHGISIDNLVNTDLSNVHLNGNVKSDENVHLNVHGNVHPNGNYPTIEEPELSMISEAANDVKKIPSSMEIYKRIMDLEADMALIKQKLLKGS